MTKKVWVYRPQKPNITIKADVKTQIKKQCDFLIENCLKPQFVKRFNPSNTKESQLVAIYCKWYRAYIHFVAVYKDLQPQAIQSEYEIKFARLEYAGRDRFFIAYLRHTGEWHDLTYGRGIALKECFNMIQKMPHFTPL